MNKNDLDELRRREVIAYKETRRLRRAFLDAKQEKDDIKDEINETNKKISEKKTLISQIYDVKGTPSPDSANAYEKFLYIKQRIQKQINALELKAQEEKDLKNDCFNLASLRGREGKKHEQAGLIMEAKGHEDKMADYNSQIFDLWAEICETEKKAKADSGLSKLESELESLKKELRNLKDNLSVSSEKVDYLKREYDKARAKHAFLKDGLKKAERNPPGD